MHRSATTSRSVRARQAVGWLGAMATLALMPVIAYALGRLAWEHAQAMISGSQLTAGAGLTTLSLGQALSPIAAGIGALVAAHLTWTALVLLATPRRSRVHAAVRSVTPATWRRLVSVAATGAMSVGLAFPAAAAVPAGAVDHTDAGWVAAPTQPATETAQTQPRNTADAEPAQPASASGISPQPQGADTSADSLEVIVAAGDTLWDITADQLGLDPGEHAAIAASWPDLYERNRDTIGADPDVIVPGQQLTIPAGWSA